MYTSSLSWISPWEHASKNLLYQLLSLSFVCIISTAHKTFKKPRRQLNFTFFRYLDNWFRELPTPRECIFGWDHTWMPNNEVGVCPWNARRCHKASISSNSENFYGHSWPYDITSLSKKGKLNLIEWRRTKSI